VLDAPRNLPSHFGKALGSITGEGGILTDPMIAFQRGCSEVAGKSDDESGSLCRRIQSSTRADICAGRRAPFIQSRSSAAIHFIKT